MRLSKSLSAVALLALLAAGRAALATPGALDENGCHYDRSNGNYHCHKEMPPNPDRYAAVKKSRENICHDKSSPNYRQLTRFVAYRSMAACIGSGGVEAQSGRGGGLSGRQ
jgi:hypothetical protein